MSPWRRDQGPRHLVRVLGDAAAACAALTCALLVRIHLPFPFTEGLLPADRLSFLARDWAPVILIQLAALYFFGFYDPPRPRTRFEVARRLVAATVAQTLGLMSYYFLFERPFPRSVLLLYVLLDFLLLLAWRVALDRTERQRERRVALVGRGPALPCLARLARSRLRPAPP
jgi:FlaA1/EpsC-like NDP-sugar epimerase